MSITSLANHEILRTSRSQLDLSAITNRHLDPVIHDLKNASPQDLHAAVRPIAEAPPIQSTPGSDALDSLAKYLPTESITLYVAAAAALPSLAGTFPSLTPLRLYLGFAVLTPILFLLVYMGKRRTQKLSPLPRNVAAWPWWKLIATTIAFLGWAPAIPPLITTQAGQVMAGFVALLISTMLSVVGAVVEPAGQNQ